MSAIVTKDLKSMDLETMNGLLRGEISAVETYEQAITKFNQESFQNASSELSRIRNEHSQASGALRQQVISQGGTPSDGAGLWGIFANTVAGAAKILGPQTALGALKQGEQHGLDAYEKAASNPEISEPCRTLIRDELMPRCHEHLLALERINSQLENDAQAEKVTNKK